MHLNQAQTWDYIFRSQTGRGTSTKTVEDPDALSTWRLHRHVSQNYFVGV